MKKIIAILAALMLVLSLTSCSEFIEGFKEGWDEATTQTFTVKEMSITLKGVFVQEDELNAEFDAVFISLDSGVMVARYNYKDLGYDTDPELDAKGLADVYVSWLDPKPTVVTEDGMVYVTETMDVDGTEFTYVHFLFVSDEAYWCVQMYCVADSYEEMHPKFMEWAKSVTFSAPASNV